MGLLDKISFFFRGRELPAYNHELYETFERASDHCDRVIEKTKYEMDYSFEPHKKVEVVKYFEDSFSLLTSVIALMPADDQIRPTALELFKCQGEIYKQRLNEFLATTRVVLDVLSSDQMNAASDDLRSTAKEVEAKASFLMIQIELAVQCAEEHSQGKRQPL